MQKVTAESSLRVVTRLSIVRPLAVESIPLASLEMFLHIRDTCDWFVLHKMPLNDNDPHLRYLNSSGHGQSDLDFPDYKIGNDIPLSWLPPLQPPHRNRYHRNGESDDKIWEESKMKTRSGAALTTSRALNKLPSPVSNNKVDLGILSHPLKAYFEFSGRITIRMQKIYLRQSASASQIPRIIA